MENNILHRSLNRGDIVLSGLPSGLTNLSTAVVKLCSFYDISITDRDINQVSYMNNKRLVLVKFINVSVRDSVMYRYYKQRSLTVKNILGGELTSRVYLNDHYSPAASELNKLCRKLMREKIIFKFKIFDADNVKAKLTMADGKDLVCDLDGCAALLENNPCTAV